MDLLLLVVLLVLGLLEDLQQAFHLGLCFPSILSVLGHFLLQTRYPYRKFSAGLGLRCGALGLEQKCDILNTLSVFSSGDHNVAKAARSTWIQ